MAPALNRPRSQRAFPLTLCAAGVAVADFLGPPILWALEADVTAALFVGAVGAQLGLLAIWAVFGPQRWILRLPVTLTYVALFYTMLAMGMTVAAAPGVEWNDIAAGYLFLPLMFLAVQLPLWILKMATGWRIVRPDPENELAPTGSRQFRLQDLFVATTLIAVTFGSAGLGMPGDDHAFATTWGPALLACLMFAALSAFSTLPCLWAGLIAKNWRTSTAVIAVYVLVMSTIVPVIIGATGGRGPSDEAFMALLFLFGTLVGVMVAVLHVLRRWGLVLRRIGCGKTPAP